MAQAQLHATSSTSAHQQARTGQIRPFRHKDETAGSASAERVDDVLADISSKIRSLRKLCFADRETVPPQSEPTGSATRAVSQNELRLTRPFEICGEIRGHDTSTPHYGFRQNPKFVASFF
jgi:hypothetical protein